MEIKKWRIENHVSQVQLAKMVGVSTYTVQLWERGVTTPNDMNLYKLNKAMKEFHKNSSNKSKGGI